MKFDERNKKKIKIPPFFISMATEFNIFFPLVTITMAAILNLFNPQKLPHTTVDVPTKFHEV
jgi:hypothetical protein